MNMIGTMDRREIIGDIIGELKRRQATKIDFAMPTSKLSLDEAGRLVVAELESFTVNGRRFGDWTSAEAFANEQTPVASVVPNGKIGGAFDLAPTALAQLCDKIDVPVKVIRDRLAGGNRDLAAHLVSGLLSRDDNRMMVRTLDGRARAVLATRYLPLDNADLFFHAFGEFKNANAAVWKARLSDDAFELFGVSETIKGHVTNERFSAAGAHEFLSLPDGVPDEQRAAVRIRNSETGRGGLQIDFTIFRSACKNTAIIGKAFRSVHLGADLADDGLVESNETRDNRARLVWSKVADAVRTAFEPERFRTYIDRMNGLTRQAIAAPVAIVDAVVAKYELPEAARDAILAQFTSQRDPSRYGLVQAVTWQAHEAEANGDVELAGSFEAVGGELVDMPDKEFAGLVTA